MNIARAHGEDQIAGFGDGRDLLDSLVKRGAVADIGAVDGVDQRKRIDAGDGSFAGGVNIEHTNHIGGLKAIAKFMQKIAGAGIAMRLKENENAREAALAGRFQSGANFCGVMAVIIDDGDAADLTFALKAPLDAAKIRQPGSNLFRRTRRAAHRWQRRRWHFSGCAGRVRKA